MKTKKSKLIKSGKSLCVYIPADLTKDNSFPFNEGDTVQITIKKSSLVIKKTSLQEKKNQAQNKRFMDQLLTNSEFVATNIGKWVIVSEGKLLAVVDQASSIQTVSINLTSPILIKQLSNSKRNRKIHWSGGSLSAT